MSTDWTDKITAFDLETTGTDPMTDRIVSAALVDFDDGEPVDAITWEVDPGVPIPEQASAVHGVWEADRAGRQDHDTAVLEIVEELGDAWRAGYTVVVFNAAFDLTMLQARARDAGAEFTIGGPVVDPMVADRYLDKWRKGKRTLGVQCQHYGVALENAHDAEADAEAAARLAIAQAAKWPGEFAAEGLMERQERWARENHDSLKAWMRRQGKSTANLQAGWPIWD